MTPLISAETWLGAAGWASGSQTWSGTSPAFDPAPNEHEHQHQRGDQRGEEWRMRGWHAKA